MYRWNEYFEIEIDDELRTILQFFVIESPVKEVSARGKTFEEMQALV